MYGFVPDPQGGLLYIGYTHMLSPLTAATNTITNQLIDSGTLANLQSGWLAKGFRKKMGDVSLTPGQYQQTGLSAQDLQQGIMLHPTKEPSAVLYQLRNDLVASSEQYSASADLSGALGPQAPAATTLALIQEQQLSSGAIILRIYRTMAREFKLLFKLDSQFVDPKEYLRVVDDEAADPKKDFNLKELDIAPSANPELSSRMMRIQQANAELAYLEQVQLASGDIRPIVKGYYEAIGSQNVDQIFPEQSPEEQLQGLLARHPQLEQLLMDAQQQNAAIAKAQADAVDAQNSVLIAQAGKLQEEAKQVSIETKAKVHKTSAELDKLEADIAKTKAETFLTLEKADTEETKNNISKYEHATNLDSSGGVPMTEMEEESPEDYMDEEEEPITEQVIDENTGEEYTATFVNGKWEIS
jgi:hypothetical protein